MTKFIFPFAIVVVLYFAVPSQGDLFRERRHDNEIKNRKHDHIRTKAGVPLVFDHKKAYMRTGIPELRRPEDVDSTGDSNFRDEDEDMDTDQSSEAGVSSKTGDVDEDDDDSGDDEENGKLENDKDKKNPEELGQGYEKIGDMGSHNKDDSDDDDSQGSKGTSSSDGDIMSKNSADSKKVPDLNGEFPPTADEVKNLPKEKQLTSEEATRKMAEKRKGYIQFTIKQKYSPELKYKESASYKILAGNVRQDVERALRATGVVRDVLFREAKDIGGPPYRSKVRVFLKIKNASEKKIKRIVDYGLINGMMTVPGSFYAN